MPSAAPPGAPGAPSPGAPGSWRAARAPRWLSLLLLVLGLAAAAAMLVSWTTQRRVAALEQELVRRQEASQGQAGEAQMLARQAQDSARESAAKVALLEARVAEASLQRSQVEELMQSMSRSRDENVVADVEASLRVALQQTAITGSAEPLVAALKLADERLSRYNQPRLERARRAVLRDLERVKSLAVADISALVLRLDEAVRLVDELPLLSSAERRGSNAPRPGASAPGARRAAAPAPAASASEPSWQQRVAGFWQDLGSRVWEEVRSLVRVTRIDNPEAMLMAPEQAYFVRENLKLRLLNARLALLSRQYETAQLDLRDAQATLDRYFDRSSRRVVAASELVRQVAAQARLTTVPHPDESLAALAAAAAGR